MKIKIKDNNKKVIITLKDVTEVIRNDKSNEYYIKFNDEKSCYITIRNNQEIITE